MRIFRSKHKDEDRIRITTKEVLANNRYILGLAWRIHPQRIIADFVKSGLEQFSRVFYSVIFVKYLLESMEKGSGFGNLAIFIFVTLFIFMLVELYSRWYEVKFKPISDSILYEKLYEMLFRKASEVDLNCYEDVDFYNKYTIAIKEADTRVSAVIENIASILFAILAAISIFSVMYSIDHYVALFALSPIIGHFIIGKRFNQLQYSKNLDSVPYLRRMDYVNRTLYLSNYAKELRLSNVFQVLKNTYNLGYTGILKVIDQYKNRLMLVDFWRSFFTFLLMFQGVLFYGAYRAMISESISISEFAVLTTAMVTGAWTLINMSTKFVAVYENGMYINNLHYFLQYESSIQEQEGGRMPEPPTEITFSNVSFGYKGAKSLSMNNINMTIPRNAKIALVGHNGAGKSTFIKLLMRLYDTTEGVVSLNGLAIQDYDLKQYRSLFGAAFQDYQVFSMTIGENVLMKELETAEERELVIQSLRKSGVYDKVMSLPRGIDTILTREFDDEGVMLSGGELQKIAVARVFAKNAEIIIMDEPTSALDPIAEYQLYENIMDVCSNKMVIFISHRLSSAVLADHIYLFEDGTIIENGTHSQLMAKNGKYAEMFTKQAEKYVEKGDYAESKAR